MYVMVAGLNDSVFWGADVSFVRSVSLNKIAYDSWLTSEQKKLMSRR